MNTDKTLEVLDAVASEYSLKDTGHETEFEPQAWLYCALAASGFNVKGEVKKQLQGRQVCRFDLVVFDWIDGDALVIIECKRKGKSPVISHQRQGKRYTRFGVPVLSCSGFDGARKAHEYILKHMSQNVR